MANSTSTKTDKTGVKTWKGLVFDHEAWWKTIKSPPPLGTDIQTITKFVVRHHPLMGCATYCFPAMYAIIRATDPYIGAKFADAVYIRCPNQKFDDSPTNATGIGNLMYAIVHAEKASDTVQKCRDHLTYMQQTVPLKKAGNDNVCFNLPQRMKAKPFMKPFQFSYHTTVTATMRASIVTQVDRLFSSVMDSKIDTRPYILTLVPPNGTWGWVALTDAPLVDHKKMHTNDPIGPVVNEWTTTIRSSGTQGDRVCSMQIRQRFYTREKSAKWMQLEKTRQVGIMDGPDMFFAMLDDVWVGSTYKNYDELRMGVKVGGKCITAVIEVPATLPGTSFTSDHSQIFISRIGLQFADFIRQSLPPRLILERSIIPAPAPASDPTWTGRIFDHAKWFASFDVKELPSKLDSDATVKFIFERHPLNGLSVVSCDSPARITCMSKVCIAKFAPAWVVWMLAERGNELLLNFIHPDLKTTMDPMQLTVLACIALNHSIVNVRNQASNLFDEMRTRLHKVGHDGRLEESMTIPSNRPATSEIDAFSSRTYTFPYVCCGDDSQRMKREQPPSPDNEMQMQKRMILSAIQSCEAKREKTADPSHLPRRHMNVADGDNHQLKSPWSPWTGHVFDHAKWFASFENTSILPKKSDLDATMKFVVDRHPLQGAPTVTRQVPLQIACMSMASAARFIPAWIIWLAEPLGKQLVSMIESQIENTKLDIQLEDVATAAYLALHHSDSVVRSHALLAYEQLCERRHESRDEKWFTARYLQSTKYVPSSNVDLPFMQPCTFEYTCGQDCWMCVKSDEMQKTFSPRLLSHLGSLASVESSPSQPQVPMQKSPWQPWVGVLFNHEAWFASLLPSDLPKRNDFEATRNFVRDHHPFKGVSVTEMGMQVSAVLQCMSVVDLARFASAEIVWCCPEFGIDLVDIYMDSYVRPKFQHKVSEPDMKYLCFPALAYIATYHPAAVVRKCALDRYNDQKLGFTDSLFVVTQHTPRPLEAFEVHVCANYVCDSSCRGDHQHRTGSTTASVLKTDVETGKNILAAIRHCQDQRGKHSGASADIQKVASSSSSWAESCWKSVPYNAPTPTMTASGTVTYDPVLDALDKMPAVHDQCKALEQQVARVEEWKIALQRYNVAEERALTAEKNMGRLLDDANSRLIAAQKTEARLTASFKHVDDDEFHHVDLKHDNHPRAAAVKSPRVRPSSASTSAAIVKNDNSDQSKSERHRMLCAEFTACQANQRLLLQKMDDAHRRLMGVRTRLATVQRVP